MITFFVDEYMNTHEEISSNDIAALENEIRIAVKSSADNLKSTTETKQNEGKPSDSRNSSRVQVLLLVHHGCLILYFAHVTSCIL